MKVQHEERISTLIGQNYRQGAQQIPFKFLLLQSCFAHLHSLLNKRSDPMLLIYDLMEFQWIPIYFSKAAVIFGEAELVPNLQAKKRVWHLATFDLSQHFPQGPESEEFCVLKIAISKVEWRDSWETGTKIYKPA